MNYKSAHVAEVSVRPLGKEGVVRFDGVSVHLAPADKLVWYAQPLQGQTLAVVAGEEGYDIQFLHLVVFQIGSWLVNQGFVVLFLRLP